MDIFFTVDENYRLFLFVTILSILTNAKESDHFNFHVLDAGLSEETKDNVEKLQKIKTFKIDYTKMNDDDFLEYPINPVLTSKIYYYRLKIPYLFPNVKRALFLDTDLFVESSLSELYNIDMQGKTVAFVPNANLENELQNFRLGLSQEHIYFNAGVMLIDCDKWRDLNIEEQTLKIAKEKYKVLKWADQDMLNIIFENNYLSLNPKWNNWPGMNIEGYEPTEKNYHKWFYHVKNIDKNCIKSFMKKPCIIHYSGGAKPDRNNSMEYIKKEFTKYEKKLSNLGIKIKNESTQRQYNEDFYKEQAENSYKSAKMFIPYLMEYCKPNSIIDIGCGVGTWLKAFQESGVELLFGIDGNDVDEKHLYMSRSLIQTKNLERLERNNGEKYDLLISLEVAEHLNKDSADKFIDALVSYSDAIFFSAAIPYQGGVNHVNEQPPQYWVDKFAQKGYKCFDIIRDKLLNDENLFYGCYAQNGFIFTNRPEKLEQQGFKPTPSPMFFYHPWYIKAKEAEIQSLKKEILTLKKQKTKKSSKKDKYMKIFSKIIKYYSD